MVIRAAKLGSMWTSCPQRITTAGIICKRDPPVVSRLFSTTSSFHRVVSAGIKRQQKEAKKSNAKIITTTYRNIPTAKSAYYSSPKEFEKQLIYALYLINPNSKSFKEELSVSDIDLGDLTKAYTEFRRLITDQLSGGAGGFKASGVDLGIPSINRLRAMFERKGTAGLCKYCKAGFYEWLGFAGAHELNFGRYENAADIRFPQEWYVSARQIQRTWHLHVGPTNSGKTYQALKRLEEAGNGIYAGPLRLLAHEIFERMNAKGIPCNLITGDDIRVLDDHAQMTSSTMEMVNLSREVDVCVIDEIQMIGDPERGWAWTQALLGVRAKEVHLCGEERTVHLIRQLAASVGDKLIIHWYNRLGPLEVMSESLDGDLKKLEDGDCVVTFSRRNIFALKRSIEEQSGKRCAVVYGSLPPETRSTQAQLFNDQDSEYKILVASDAIGMGLNLSIKRVIFESMEKWNGTATVSIEVPQAKQIAGRAGRYRVHNKNDNVKKDETLMPLPAAPQPGYVTTLDKPDHKALQTAMNTNAQQIKTAGIIPQPQHIEHFAAQLQDEISFSQVLSRLEEYISTSTLFHPCSFKENIQSAALIDHIKALSVNERLIFISAPRGNTPEAKIAFRNMADCVANNKDGSILKISDIDLEALDTIPRTIQDLTRFESLHKVLILYLWLSFRFPTTFTPRETAQELKTICEHKIQKGLQTIRFIRKKLRRGLKSTLVASAVTNASQNSAASTEEMLDMSQNSSTSTEEMLDVPKEDEEVFDEKAERYRRNIICYRCNKFGHMQLNCPVLSRCFSCGGIGHISKLCPAKGRSKGKDRKRQPLVRQVWQKKPVG